MTHPATHKRALGSFLAHNPFPGPLTDGLYFRDKMRAIHRIAPDERVERLLEVGGGQSGLSALLYPASAIVNLDMNPAYAAAPCNRDDPRVTFVAGSATDVPFDDDTFDMVTMFDLLEHVPDDAAVAREAMRVLRPGGWILVSTPDRERWKYPYYGIFQPICPSEETLFADWGHVRRGYTLAELEALFAAPATTATAFINSLLALNHDIAFSRLSRGTRFCLHALLTPVSLVGWVMHRHHTPGTEIAAAWKKGAA